MGLHPVNIAFRASIVPAIALFLANGTHVLFLGGMVADFQRFELIRMRRLTGTLQMLGAVGLAAGMRMPVLVVPSAFALTALMLFGIAARIRARDALSKSLPALALVVLNLFVVACALGGVAGSE